MLNVHKDTTLLGVLQAPEDFHTYSVPICPMRLQIMPQRPFSQRHRVPRRSLLQYANRHEGALTSISKQSVNHQMTGEMYRVDLLNIPLGGHFGFHFVNP